MQTLQQNSSNRINTPIKWNAPCLFYRPALPPGNSSGWRPVTWHLIIQGRWEIKLGRVDNILLRLSYLSWLLFIFLPAPSTTPQSVTINIQSLNLVFESLKVAQFKLKEKKKKRGEEDKIFSLTALLPHPLSSGANRIFTNQWGRKDHFLTAHIKARTLRKLVRSRTGAGLTTRLAATWGIISLTISLKRKTIMRQPR